MKDKAFELELSWVCDESERYLIAPHQALCWRSNRVFVLLENVCQHTNTPHERVHTPRVAMEINVISSCRKHMMVPKEVREEAIKLAVEAKEKAEMEDSSDEEEEKED